MVEALEIYISVEDEKWNHFGDYKKICELVLEKTFIEAENNINLKNKKPEISILLTNDEQIQEINREYRGKDKATNVISFASIDDGLDFIAEEETVALGDIVISYDTLEKEAKEANIEIEHHLYHLLCHGMLHLLGFDHIDDDEADEMEAIEIKIMDEFNIKNPYNI